VIAALNVNVYYFFHTNLPSQQEPTWLVQFGFFTFYGFGSSQVLHIFDIIS